VSGQPDRVADGSIRHLGHAGFLVEHAGTGILMDPGVHAAFLHAWLPLPDNRAAVVDPAAPALREAAPSAPNP
jgi:L-ascorbate metabolism protein UlaG (beta-lactamase superfamily)